MYAVIHNVRHSVTSIETYIHIFFKNYLFRYLAELLQERQKLAPFLQVMPHCCRLLNQGGLLSHVEMLTDVQVLELSFVIFNAFSLVVFRAEIRKISSLSDLDRYENGSPFRSLGQPTNGKIDLDGWPMMQGEVRHQNQNQKCCFG